MTQDSFLRDPKLGQDLSGNDAPKDTVDINTEELVKDLPDNDNDSETPTESVHKSKVSIFFEERSKSIARRPWTYLLVGLFVSIILSFISLVVGKFRISVNNEGWYTRGTLIGKRQQTLELVNEYNYELFSDKDGSFWEYLKTNIPKRTSEEELRRLSNYSSRKLTFNLDDYSDQEASLVQCDLSWYTSDLLNDYNLVAVWKTVSEDTSILDNNVLKDICEAEVSTLASLKKNNLCKKCDSGECYSPYSIVSLIRLETGTVRSSCDDVLALYTSSVKAKITAMLSGCTEELLTTTNITGVTSCPPGFHNKLIDADFGAGKSSVLQYSTSIFSTPGTFESLTSLNALQNEYDRAMDSKVVNGAYETLDGSLAPTQVDETLLTDMILATAAGAVTAIAIIIHTKSLWLSLIGLLQIIFSFPLAYFVYHFIARLSYFPFLNFIGVFIVFALGADDIFVAVDKFKSARRTNPKATTEDVASLALPEAAYAMFLTTITTSVAFFATTICPVAPILCFAVFCGLLILFDYIMNLVLVFPALCIYDKWLMQNKRNCFISFIELVPPESKTDEIEEQESSDVKDFSIDSDSLINRLLTGYYEVIHRLRYILVICSVAGLAVSIYYSATLQLPNTSTVRLLPSSHQYEINYEWSENLWSLSSGHGVSLLWGVEAADTGNHNDPESFSQLVLDETFNPRSEESQLFLLEFCDIIMDTDFANRPYESHVCPFNAFDLWLRQESNSTTPDAFYESYCNGETSVPVALENFDACINAYSQSTFDTRILSEKGIVKIIKIVVQNPYNQKDSFSIVNSQWKSFENWFDSDLNNVPDGLKNGFHSSLLFLWMDTNYSMLNTAIGAGIIAVVFAFLVICLSSRSLMLTIFSTISILYVLVATMASVVGFGWSLGFLESICVAILIGISCDFVIHFSHAYSHYDGSVSRHVRTKFAVVHMGPSILAASVTTMSGAIVMLFCKITFFQRFATILLMTILHATIGSFVVFVVLADIFGPQEPTKLFDTIVGKLCKKNTKSVDC